MVDILCVICVEYGDCGDYGVGKSREEWGGVRQISMKIVTYRWDQICMRQHWAF